MSFSSDDIQVLRIIAQTGSFRKTAEVLHRVPSAISYTVKRIEEELGIPLFDRSSKNIELTPAALHIIQQGDWILRSINELKRSAVQLSTGVDRTFTIALNYIVNPKPISNLLYLLNQKFPSTEFAIRTEVYNGSWDALYEGRADFVIGAPQSAPISDGISAKYIGEIPWDFVVSSNHDLASQTKLLTTEILRPYPSIIVHDSSVSLLPKKTWRLNGQKIIYAADLNMVLELIQSGLGIGFLPKHFVAPAISNGSVVVKDIVEHKQPVAVSYAWRSQQKSAVLDFLLNLLNQADRKQSWLQ